MCINKQLLFLISVVLLSVQKPDVVANTDMRTLHFEIHVDTNKSLFVTTVGT